MMRCRPGTLQSFGGPRSKVVLVPDQRATLRAHTSRDPGSTRARARAAPHPGHTQLRMLTPCIESRLRRSRVSSSPTIRLGVDIGGTFTDVALELGERRFTAKTLTTTAMPEKGVLAALGTVTAEAGISPDQVGLIIHGTTLATNALIERKGARTALLTTEGFRDVVEIRHENRFEQYDVNIDLPPPLVPRRLRLPIRERIDAHGEVLIALDGASVRRAIDALAAQQVEAVAVGFLHSFTNPEHERAVGDAIARALPHVPLTLSCEVAPEMREYERFSTACANAYIQPLIGRYLAQLESELARAGFRCPLLLMTSGERHHERRDRHPLSGPPGRIGSGRRRDFRRQHRPPARARSGLVLRYGRHHRQDLSHRQGAAAERARDSRSRASIVSSRAAGCRCAFRQSRWSRSVPAAARSHGSMRSDASRWVRIAPARSRDRPVTPVAAAEPTVTDADLLLGRIDPATFSGGTMTLDVASADARHLGAHRQPR